MLRLTERHIRRRGGGMFALAVNLLELMVVVAVVAVFSAIAYPSYRRNLARTRITQAIAEMKAIEQAIQQHQLTNDGILPDDLAQIGMASLRDPWGNPYRYLKIGHTQGSGPLRKDKNRAALNTDYDLYSTGADGTSGSQLWNP
jgi:general secretion pathway protein G